MRASRLRRARDFGAQGDCVGRRTEAVGGRGRGGSRTAAALKKIPAVFRRIPWNRLAEDFLVEGAPVVKVVEVDGGRADGAVVCEAVGLEDGVAGGVRVDVA